MKKGPIDSDTAKAFLILCRDGVMPLSDLIAKTRHIADRYIRKYRRYAEDVAAIARAAHWHALATYPINSTISLYGWIVLTIRREVIDSMRSDFRYRRAGESLSAALVGESPMADPPECAYLAAEREYIIQKSVESSGSISREVLKRVFWDEGDCNMTYYKEQKHLDLALRTIRTHRSIQELA